MRIDEGDARTVHGFAEQPGAVTAELAHGQRERPRHGHRIGDHREIVTPDRRRIGHPQPVSDQHQIANARTHHRDGRANRQEAVDHPDRPHAETIRRRRDQQLSVDREPTVARRRERLDRNRFFNTSEVDDGETAARIGNEEVLQRHIHLADRGRQLNARHQFYDVVERARRRTLVRRAGPAEQIDAVPRRAEPDMANLLQRGQACRGIRRRHPFRPLEFITDQQRAGDPVARRVADQHRVRILRLEHRVARESDRTHHRRGSVQRQGDHFRPAALRGIVGAFDLQREARAARARRQKEARLVGASRSLRQQRADVKVVDIKFDRGHQTIVRHLRDHALVGAPHDDVRLDRRNECHRRRSVGEDDDRIGRQRHRLSLRIRHNRAKVNRQRFRFRREVRQCGHQLEDTIRAGGDFAETDAVADEFHFGDRNIVNRRGTERCVRLFVEAGPRRQDQQGTRRRFVVDDGHGRRRGHRLRQPQVAHPRAQFHFLRKPRDLRQHDRKRIHADVIARTRGHRRFAVLAEEEIDLGNADHGGGVHRHVDLRAFDKIAHGHHARDRHHRRLVFQDREVQRRRRRAMSREVPGDERQHQGRVAGHERQRKFELVRRHRALGIECAVDEELDLPHGDRVAGAGSQDESRALDHRPRARRRRRDKRRHRRRRRVVSRADHTFVERDITRTILSLRADRHRPAFTQRRQVHVGRIRIHRVDRHQRAIDEERHGGSRSGIGRGRSQVEHAAFRHARGQRAQHHHRRHVIHRRRFDHASHDRMRQRALCAHDRFEIRVQLNQ